MNQSGAYVGGFAGKRYRRHDEIGTPMCVTVDHDTLKDNTVTIRCRDTMKQVACDGALSQFHANLRPCRFESLWTTSPPSTQHEKPLVWDSNELGLSFNVG